MSKQWMIEWMGEWMDGWMREWMNEYMNEWKTNLNMTNPLASPFPFEWSLTWCDPALFGPDKEVKANLVYLHKQVLKTIFSGDIVHLSLHQSISNTTVRLIDMTEIWFIEILFD